MVRGAGMTRKNKAIFSIALLADRHQAEAMDC